MFRIHSLICFITQVQDRLCTALPAQIFIQKNTLTYAISTPIVNQGPHTHPSMMMLSSPGFGNGLSTSHRTIGKISAIILHDSFIAYLFFIPRILSS
mmetsp:Transcript_4157/g.8354  ORF Transcript_4157/g.8354 Transcript_4157/m.8354 type:complete len:97 (+) Transcript_4157:897-1187(+)